VAQDRTDSNESIQWLSPSANIFSEGHPKLYMTIDILPSPHLACLGTPLGWPLCAFWKSQGAEVKVFT
jgi:hypothetical protein